MAANGRQIFKNATMGQNAAREVLAMVFAREVLVPSKELFLVEPWISDVVLFDNRSGEFDALCPDWGHREVRLVDIIQQLSIAGVLIYVVLRPETHNRRFTSKLGDALADSASSQQCCVTEVEYLHTKGILSDHALILGSMNLTEHGVALNDEQISVSFEQQEIADARVHFESYVRA